MINVMSFRETLHHEAIVTLGYKKGMSHYQRIVGTYFLLNTM
jgi:hypothetical protein